MHRPRLLHRLPAHLLNGLSVALGIGIVQAATSAAGGPGAALVATGGAVFASLADLPNTPRRTLWRVSTAALVGCSVALLVGLLRSDVLLLGIVTAAVAFLSTWALAWGVRAGPISFVGILAIVFTLAAPPVHDLRLQAQHAAWTWAGGALYLATALAASRLLQPRYRSLALAAAIGALAQLLRSRAALVVEDAGRPGANSPLQDWIGREAALSERLQAARDFLFAAPDTPTSRRQTAALLLVIDLRDTLLASELDLDEFGHDGPDGRLREALGQNLHAIADLLDALAQAQRLGLPVPAWRAPGAPVAGLRHSRLFPDPWRARLVEALTNRAQHMVDDLGRMHAVLAAADATLALRREELQLFVSVEGWPLAALKARAHRRSPLLRQAVRQALALGSAYFIAQALPWSSHPAWLVLSVGVVLRGNLEQTLSRRNARVAGTIIGCGVVLLLAALNTAWLSATLFLVAVGVAHSFIATRYLVTAAAASVMALLQAHLAHPAGGLAVGERIADTLLGALLAWGFSYVLPAWERGTVAATAQRVTRALAAMASETLQWPQADARHVPLRLARREVYEALDAIAAAAQRSRVEPESVQVPLYAFATLLARSQVLLAHLAAVRLLLVRRAAELDRPATEAALAAAVAELQRRLEGERPASASASVLSPAITGAPGLAAADATAAEPPAAAEAPERPGAVPAAGDALLPWLQRRLALASATAGRVTEAARALRAVAARPSPPTPTSASTS